MYTTFQSPVSNDGVALSTFKSQATPKPWNQPYNCIEASLFGESGLAARSIKSSKAAEIYRFQENIYLNHQKQNLVFRKHKVCRKFTMKSSTEFKKNGVSSGTCLPHSYEVPGELSPFSKKGATNQKIDIQQLHNLLEAYLIKDGLLKEKFLKETSFPGTFLFEDINTKILSNKIKDFNADEIFSLATESKESSLSLQAYISDCDVNDLERVIAKIKYFIPMLMNHCFGNFVVQRLVVKSETIFKQVECMAKEKFEEFIMDEFSSRVLQLLIEKSEVFCKFALNYFKRNIKKSISCNSSCHLILACIRNAQDVSSIEFVHDYLRRNPRYMGNKFYHRILITYLQTASDSQVNRLAYTLGSHYSLCQILNKKACSNMLLILIQRGEPTTLESVNLLLKNDVARLLETKYFLLVIQKLSQSQDSKFLSDAFDILSKIKKSEVQYLFHSEKAMYQYLFVVMLCCNRDFDSNLDCFLERPEIKIQISKIMNSSITNRGVDSTTSI